LVALPSNTALRFAPCHNRLCGNVSPLTASVNESSVGVLDALVVTVEDLVVEVVFEPVEPDAHAASAKTIMQNLMNRRK